MFQLSGANIVKINDILLIMSMIVSTQTVQKHPITVHDRFAYAFE